MCDQYFWKWNVVLKFICQFEHRQQDFRVPIEISLVYWQYKAINFSLHYSIKYFKNNNCSQIFWAFFSVDASFSERFPEKCSTLHSNAGHYKEEFECLFHSLKYWSRVMWIDCNREYVNGPCFIPVIWTDVYLHLLLLFSILSVCQGAHWQPRYSNRNTKKLGTCMC